MADNRNPSLVAFDQRATLASQRAATRARLNVLRMMSATPAGHVGGALSCIDALAVLYTNVLNIDPANPKDPQRDRFLHPGMVLMPPYPLPATLLTLGLWL